jgi:hypothetical protein
VTRVDGRREAGDRAAGEEELLELRGAAGGIVLRRQRVPEPRDWQARVDAGGRGRVGQRGLDDDEAGAAHRRERLGAQRVDDAVLAAGGAVAGREVEAIEHRDRLEARDRGGGERIDRREPGLGGARAAQAVALGIAIGIVAVAGCGRGAEGAEPRLVQRESRGGGGARGLAHAIEHAREGERREGDRIGVGQRTGGDHATHRARAGRRRWIDRVDRRRIGIVGRRLDRRIIALGQLDARGGARSQRRERDTTPG